MDLETIYEKFPIYRGLNPATKPKREWKILYKTIQDKLISEGRFPNKQARGLNLAVLNEIGEFPYWKHKGNDVVELGEGVVHKMSGGEPRPFNVRQASNLKADNIRKQRTKWANDLMSAAGFETEVQEGSSLFSAKNRVGGKAWDHTYELQDFGPRYKAILEDFASGSIDEATFKNLVAGEVSKNPGDIKRNLELLDEADNYAKRARIEGEVKEFKKGEAYKVRDAKYTEFQKLDDVTKASKLEEAHKQAVKFTKYDIGTQIAKEAPNYQVTKVVEKVNGNGLNGNGLNGNGSNGLVKNGKVLKPTKAPGVLGAARTVINNKAVRKAVKWVPVVGGGMVLLNAKAQAEEAIANPTWQNKAQAGLAGVDAALEGIELATGGVAGIITTPLQIGTMIADQLIHQTEDSFSREERDWDARIASRRSQR